MEDLNAEFELLKTRVTALEEKASAPAPETAPDEKETFFSKVETKFHTLVGELKHYGIHSSLAAEPVVTHEQPIGEAPKEVHVDELDPNSILNKPPVNAEPAAATPLVNNHESEPAPAVQGAQVQ